MVSSSWFRRHQKTVYIIMIFAMFVWGISYSAMEMIPKKPIGKMFGRKITQNEFADMLGRWQRLFFPQESNLIVSLVWKQLMFIEQAKRMGIVVTDQEVEDGLQRLGFQIFGGQQPNINRLELIQFLCTNFRLNQDQIVRTLREALLVEKLDSMLRSSTKMTSEEIWQRYSLENEQVKFKVATLRAKDFINSVQVTEDEINAYYEKYKDVEYSIDSEKPGYKAPERVKIECLLAKYDDIEKQMSVTAEEMKKYYDDNKDTQFKIIEEESKAGDDVAKGETEIKNASSNENKDLEKMGEESIQKGKETSLYKSFAEVKEEIRKALAKQKAMEKATEIMNKVDEEIYETLDKAERPSFQNLASRYTIAYEIPKGKKSDNEFLTENDLWEIFPGSDQIIQAVFDRDKFEPSVPFEYVEGKVIFQVIDKKPSAPMPLDEVRDKVIHDLKLENGFLKAKEIAENCLGKAKDASFDDIVKLIKAEIGDKDVSVCETDYITRPIKLFNKDSRYIEALKGDRPNVAKKAFELKQGQLGTALETSDEKACYIISITDKKPADKTAFERDKENVKKRYLYEKQETFLSGWQTDLNRSTEIYVRLQ